MSIDEMRLDCPFLGESVSLTNERLEHIREHHPDLLPANRQLIDETLRTPDIVRQSKRMSNGYLFVKWYPETANGKFCVVVVLKEPLRSWVVTSYLARKVPQGEIVWKTS